MLFDLVRVECQSINIACYEFCEWSFHQSGFDLQK